MLQEFKDFINRGNVVDLAVAVVIGAAFTGIVTSFTDDVLGGILAAIGGEPDLSQAFILEIGDGEIRFGSFLTAIINFVIIAFAVFLIVKGINRMQGFRRPQEEVAETTRAELDVLEEILTELRQSGTSGT